MRPWGQPQARSRARAWPSRTQWRRSARHIADEVKSITNIYNDCLLRTIYFYERIFEFLDFRSLFMVANTCKRVQNGKQSLLHYHFHVDYSNDYNDYSLSNWAHFESISWFWVLIYGVPLWYIHQLTSRNFTAGFISVANVMKCSSYAVTKVLYFYWHLSLLIICNWRIKVQPTNRNS